MNRSLIIMIVCAVAIVAAIVWIAVRPPSDAARERDEGGWRVCGACGHEWHMSIAEAVRQSKANPEGTGWVKCPKCGAWQGMPGMLCPKCGRRFPLPLAERNEEYVHICTYCGYAPPRASLGGNEQPPLETDEVEGGD